MKSLKLKKLKCLRCGHEWYPRHVDVRKCPNKNCQSVYWDKKPNEKNDNI